MRSSLVSTWLAGNETYFLPPMVASPVAYNVYCVFCDVAADADDEVPL